MRLLWAVVHELESASKRMQLELGITGPQRLVLRVVGHFRRTTAGELAEILHVHPGSLTRVVRRLEQAGLVRRETDSKDRRRVILTLTARGARLNTAHRGTIEAAIALVLKRTPRAKIEATRGVLKEIAEVLEPLSASAR